MKRWNQVHLIEKKLEVFQVSIGLEGEFEAKPGLVGSLNVNVSLCSREIEETR